MSYNKTIVCLANSRKLSGRCVAGLELTSGGKSIWIRPVSSRLGGELSDNDRRYKNGQEVQVLDKVSIVFKGPIPHGFQPENHLIDDEEYWSRTETATFDEVAALVEA
ncbi:MAG: dual OB domain-containing protein, partial [Pseudomonas sp.]|uniref:dual OB domain-containing protein n=1 Tax=Pseudomonas sp. TaxID=306 RepID=UPI003D6E133D